MRKSRLEINFQTVLLLFFPFIANFRDLICQTCQIFICPAFADFDQIRQTIQSRKQTLEYCICFTAALASGNRLGNRF